LKNSNEAFVDKFSEKKFWSKLKRFARKAGVKVVYSALLLYYAYRRKETPAWAKRMIFGVLGYFISPIDLIPDLGPIIGYTDDFAVLAMGIVVVAVYINGEVKTKARKQLRRWFGEINEEDIREVESKL